MDTCFLTKKPEIHTDKKKASSTNGASQTGWLHLEEYKKIHPYHPAKSQLQIDQRPQHKTRYAVLISTGKDVVNRIWMVY